MTVEIDSINYDDRTPVGIAVSFQFGDDPIKTIVSRRFFEDLVSASDRGFDFEVIRVDAENSPPKYTFSGFEGKWLDCPFDTETDALAFLTALQRYKPHFPKSWGREETQDHG